MPKSLIVIIALVLIGSALQAATIWPDSVENRIPVRYYVFKVDTVFARTGADSLRCSVDTIMGKRDPMTVTISFDTVWCVPNDEAAFQSWVQFFAARLSGNAKEVEGALIKGIAVRRLPDMEGAVPPKSKKNTKGK